MGCPHCMEHTKAFTLDKGKKSSWFDCHRRFLPRNHTYRKNKTDFKKDEVVRDHPPPRLSPGAVWEQVCDFPKFTDIGKMRPQSEKTKGKRPRVVVCGALQTPVSSRPQTQPDRMSLASTQPLMPLLSSPSFISPPSYSFQHTGGPSYPFQQTGGPSFPFQQTGRPSFPFQQTGGASFPFQQTGGPSYSYQQSAGPSFPPQVPPGFQQTGGSRTTHPTQVPPSFQQTGGSRTSPIPPGGDDHVEVDQDDIEQDEDDVLLDGDNLQGDDNPDEIQIVDGRYYITPVGHNFTPSRTAAKCVSYVIQQMYKDAWTRFGEVPNKDDWFQKFKEKCTWDVLSEKAVKKVFFTRASKRLSDTLRRVRKRWERDSSYPAWVGKDTLDKLLVYWDSPQFKAKSESGKKMRASEKGGHVNAGGSISTYEHMRRMEKRLGRKPLMVELVKETRTKKSGEYVDERTRQALEDYQERLVQFLVTNPKFTPSEGQPLHPDVDFYIWNEVIGGKGRNGCFFGGGSMAGCLRSGDRNLFERVRDGEGTSRPAQLSPQMMEIIRQLAISEARRESEQREMALKAQLEEQQRQIEAMTKRQAEMEGQQSLIERMAKRQAEMEEQMRLFMQFQGSGNQMFGGNVGVGGASTNQQDNDEDLNLDDFPDPGDT
ncbi:uncharacterized protein LOC131596337 [Vicia villosa]|uniref:uncharacterized protein LOC131596337 n=1 Tax=Vicia villosa TaxID=3911 RepID=UPI00273B3586|nr:uncharacterized protein LOC131596337 [Vicia villosa]